MRVTWVWRIVGIVGLGLTLSACHQNGTVFTVDTRDDTVDLNPGDGLCADANGDCSLRAAVMEANALPGIEEIRVSSSHLLTRPEVADDTDATGDLDITEAVVIRGPGSISGADRMTRILDIDIESGLVEIEEIDFVEGPEAIRLRGAGATILRDLQIRTFESAALVLDGPYLFGDGVTFLNNVGAEAVLAESGGATFQNTTFARNHVGNGVVNVVDADVNLLHVTIAENEVMVDGDVAGIRLDPVGSGSVVVQASIVQAAASLGDGIACSGTVVGLGHNYSDDATCGFDSPTDLIVEYPTLALELTDDEPAVLALDPLAVVVDAAGAGDCTIGDRDALSNPRPDGIACDIGAVELQRGDCLDPSPGDDLQRCDFRGRDFSGWDLRGVDLRYSYLADADFTGALLTDALVQPTDIDGADFTGADLERATLGANQRVVLDGANLRDALVGGVRIVSAVGVDLTDAHVSSVRLEYPGASLENAVVEGTSFQWVDFGGVSSGGVTGQPAVLPDGFVLVNGYFIGTDANLAGASFVGLDLSEAVVYQVDATGADFTGVTFGNLVGASVLIDSTLDGADFSGSNADATVFDGSSAVGVDFSGARMRSTGWTGALVAGVDFTDTDLSNARFTDASMVWNIFSNTTCPSGVNSDDNGGNCDGQFNGFEPLA